MPLVFVGTRSAFSWSELGKRMVSDPSAILIALSNLAVLPMALFYQWSIPQLLWGYWFQSIIIGAFAVLQIILSCRKITPINAISSSLTSDPLGASILIALFFSFHYGFFHFIYASFLLEIFGLFSLAEIGPLIILFTLTHVLSFLYQNFKRTTGGIEQLTEAFISPYFRIVPMHLAIMLGSFFLWINAGLITLTIFVFVKTVADVIGHAFKHQLMLGYETADMPRT